MRYSALIRLALVTSLAAVWGMPRSAMAQQQGPIKPPQQQGQQPPPAQQHPQPQFSLTVQSKLVQVNIVVTDQDGNIITGLKQQNFRIFDDNQPEPVTNFAPNTAPITIVLLLEFSNRYSGFYGMIAKYLSYGFVDHLGPQDWAALVTFDLKPHVVVDFTHNKIEIENAIQSLFIPGFSEANTFDALIDTIGRLKDVPGKKAILLVGTGADTFSKNNLDQTYNVLKQTNVTVFCIGSAEMQEVQNPNQPISYLQAKNEMDYFGKLTGGVAWFPRFEGEMPDIFSNIVQFLRNQYSIGYTPPDASRDGKFHKIKVEVVDDKGQPMMVPNKKGKMKKIVVYAREGYIAPPLTPGD
ncbi:MAG: VWA domain-containing protein [Candidatus Acidiferrales bacterium]